MRRVLTVLSALAMVASATSASADHGGSPDDPLFHCQWSLHHVGQAPGTCEPGTAPGPDVDAREAWALADALGPRQEVVVAIVDSGFDLTHPDLASRLWVNEDEVPGNLVDDDGNGWVDDVHGWNFAARRGEPPVPFEVGDHGTHVAGIAAAAARDGVGIAGIAGLPGHARIMVLQSSGPPHGLLNPVPTTTEQTIAAWDYARENGALVVNNSFSAPTYANLDNWGTVLQDPAVREASRRLSDADVVQVFAATYGADFPVWFDGWDLYDLPGVLRVTSTGHDGRRNAGTQQSCLQIELGAPGARIHSAVAGGGWAFQPDRDGGATSQAAPHVTGAAALIRSVHPTLSAPQVARAVVEGVDPEPTLASTRSGGRLNVHGALLRAGELASP